MRPPSKESPPRIRLVGPQRRAENASLSNAQQFYKFVPLYADGSHKKGGTHAVRRTIRRDGNVSPTSTARARRSKDILASRFRNPIALGSSARRPDALRARDTRLASRMSSPAVLRLLPLLIARSNGQHLQSSEDKERSLSREVLEQRKAEPLTLNSTWSASGSPPPHACASYCATDGPRSQTHGGIPGGVQRRPGEAFDLHPRPGTSITQHRQTVGHSMGREIGRAVPTPNLK